MTNREIADVFREIVEMLKLKGEDWFKIRAYIKVIQSIDNLQEPVETMVRENRAREIPGVGEAIDQKLHDLIETGKIPLYEKLKAEFPEYERD
jgi:DNA polymerase (family X)